MALVPDTGRSIADVARSLGIGETNLGNWARRERIDGGERAGTTWFAAVPRQPTVSSTATTRAFRPLEALREVEQVSDHARLYVSPNHTHVNLVVQRL